MTTSEGLGPAAGLLVQRQVLADDVYNVLRQWLVSGRIAPGQRITIDTISKQLGVSNTPVRQALGRLEADGLVDKAPYRGFAAVQMPGRDTVAQLYDLRIMIEPPTAALAAQGASRKDLDFLSSQLQAGATEEAPGHTAELRSADELLHGRLTEIAGNAFVTDTLDRLFSQARLLRSFYLDQAALAATRHEHDVLVAAITAHDAEGAESAMRAHLRQAQGRILAAMD